MTRISLVVVCLMLAAAPDSKAADNARQRELKNAPLRVDYMSYRPAVWEKELVTEPEQDIPNQGGLIYLYFTNTSDQPVHLRYAWANGSDAADWIRKHRWAWERRYHDVIQPGQTGVQEINATAADFAPEASVELALINRRWRPVASWQGRLQPDPVGISLIRVLPGRREVEVHFRNNSPNHCEWSDWRIPGRTISGCVQRGAGCAPGQTGLARLTLAEPLVPGELLIVAGTLAEQAATRTIMAHRRAFVDRFPIGCWSHREGLYPLLRSLHIEQVVQGGLADHPFFMEVFPEHLIKAMVPVERFGHVDTIRSLANHPATTCYMLSDEPDWHVPALVMAHSEQTVRGYNSTVPTFSTLCRNCKFFEFAPLFDIPCMDHYCVTAPSTSRWPLPYGTYLEETAWYTRDLKQAAEPKPIWVWSQAIANWSERPERPVPTPAEMEAQLMLNLGRGAKGILWFNYSHEVAEKFPDARAAMQRLGRVLATCRDELLGCEPIQASATVSHEQVDCAVLAGWDQLVVILTNCDYQIASPEYLFKTQRDLLVELPIPDYLKLSSGVAITPAGVQPVDYQIKDQRLVIRQPELVVSTLMVFQTDPNWPEEVRANFAEVAAREVISLQD